MDDLIAVLPSDLELRLPAPVAAFCSGCRASAVCADSAKGSGDALHCCVNLFFLMQAGQGHSES